MNCKLSDSLTLAKRVEQSANQDRTTAPHCHWWPSMGSVPSKVVFGVTGAPQGTVFSPFLFTIYTADVFFAVLF